MVYVVYLSCKGTEKIVNKTKNIGKIYVNGQYCPK